MSGWWEWLTTERLALLVTAAAVIVGPIIAGHMQRRADHARWLDDRRADTYVTLLAEIDEWIAVLAGSQEVDELQDLNVDQALLQARLNAFGSERIMRLTNDLMQHAHATRAAAAAKPIRLSDYAQNLAAMKAAAPEIAWQVSYELGTRRRRRRRWPGRGEAAGE